jgi:hypothetical protein
MIPADNGRPAEEVHATEQVRTVIVHTSAAHRTGLVAQDIFRSEGVDPGRWCWTTAATRPTWTMCAS